MHVNFSALIKVFGVLHRSSFLVVRKTAEVTKFCMTLMKKSGINYTVGTVKV